jgi:CubicO group peptidase (beta-lactamase class C family)
VAGVRDVNSGVIIQPADVFEIGSLTKSVTATALAALIDHGRLTWSTQVTDILNSPRIRPDYRHVSLSMLLRHRAGITRLQSPDPEMERVIEHLRGTSAEQRAALVDWMLARAPAFAPGTAWDYSNGGYVVAAALAEKVSGLSFEALLRREVFAPLMMATARIGGERRSDEARGHVAVDGRVQPVPMRENPYQLPPALEPAGAVRSSIADLIAYARAHLRGLRGQDGFLRAASVLELHRPEAGPIQPVDLFGSPNGYAAGWMVYALPGGHRVSWHNGSAGSFFGWISILPDDDLTIAVVTNQGGRERAERACRELTAMVLDRLGVLKTSPRGGEGR